MLRCQRPRPCVCLASARHPSDLATHRCRTIGDVPTKLRQKCAALRVDYGSGFITMFRWLFEMGKALTALQRDVDVTQLRTVPVNVRPSHAGRSSEIPF